MTLRNSLVWFRRDLRIDDHAALHHALRSSNRVACVFVFDTDILAGLPRDDRRVQFIHASLGELDARLREWGAYLIVRQGRAADEIGRLAAELEAESVFANHDYEPQAIARDREVQQRLRAAGRSLQTFKDQVIFETDEVLTQAGGPFSVFTPYKNAWLKRLAAHPDALQAFETAPWAGALASAAPGPALPTLEQLGFAPNPASIVPSGMSGAQALLDAFLTRIDNYHTERDFPALDSTSRLSVHLRFGTLSIRALVRMLLERSGDGARTWLSELIWREFYMMILQRHPRVVTHSFKAAFDRLRWEEGKEADDAFAAWCEGRTGYPLVDAAMAQLNRTGFMHNRLRMVTASFLTKDLGISWVRGERYFAEKLNDYELSSNNGGWQWAASTGCDAQPWFRIFNPVTQSKRFDPDGAFIRRWLPALAALDKAAIHAPWLAKPVLLERAGFVLGRDYPAPIVDHEQARERTLARFGVLKAEAD
ncbi:deoxyribodipyrimidine photolyase [Massilia sp. WF1]|uniref:cryptochrome/photolyase family protein n=1 Tax=unclassified Massilia TaxID=2609279 RepID=UPI00064A0A1C|nr:MULTISPECIES: deoxyribodipyrimidine photo-lyase [unclassified Massilia]ALK98852.1 deoxyribodipyrimidine photolyase [Massilia sp. WG5]KLU38600.1 deoxyribodipyrimidine photolyase [Massilia sp. WF1]